MTGDGGRVISSTLSDYGVVKRPTANPIDANDVSNEAENCPSCPSGLCRGRRMAAPSQVSVFG